jgi:hypothetical protein
MKYHEVSFKASHNSYERDEPIDEQLTFLPGDPAHGGCRGLEFDIWRHSGAKERLFTVHHSISIAGYPLAYYLGLMLAFHLNQPDHDPILVTIDIKSSSGAIPPFPNEIDGYISRFFNRDLVFTPGQLFKIPGVTLCENVVRLGWPDIKDMRGKFIFCLSGTPAWKNFYATLDPSKQLCFVDKEVDDDDPNLVIPIRGNFVFFNMNIFTSNFPIWKNTLPLFLKKNLITRVYEVNKEPLWDKALHAAASAIATNQVSGKSWAKVGSSPFVKRKVS